jgi:hypothetical protein
MLMRTAPQNFPKYYPYHSGFELYHLGLSFPQINNFSHTDQTKINVVLDHHFLRILFFFVSPFQVIRANIAIFAGRGHYLSIIIISLSHRRNHFKMEVNNLAPLSYLISLDGRRWKHYRNFLVILLVVRDARLKYWTVKQPHSMLNVYCLDYS